MTVTQSQHEIEVVAGMHRIPRHQENLEMPGMQQIPSQNEKQERLGMQQIPSPNEKPEMPGMKQIQSQKGRQGMPVTLLQTQLMCYRDFQPIVGMGHLTRVLFVMN